MKIYRGIACLCALLSMLASTVTQAAADKSEHSRPPNILLIVAEDMSSRVGAFGDTVAQTPSIDALANEGVRYTNVFTASGVCAPSRSALMTGVYPISMGTQQMRTQNIVEVKEVINYDAVPPPEVKAFPELLRRAGYVTANSSKKDYQFGDPFTLWDLYVADHVPADLALWRKLPDDRPFFVMLNMMVTHESFLAPPLAPGAVVTHPLLGGIPKMRAQMMTAVTDPASVTVPAYLPDTPQVRASIAQHYDNIHFMDKQVGTVLAALEEDGLADNTIVIWTTDHGDGFPRAKRSIYDSGTKVPLVIRYPDGHSAGSSQARLVSFVDLAPTLLSLANIPVPEFVQGRNFIDGPEREYVYAARDRMDAVVDRVRSVRDDRYRYIRNYLPEEPYFRPLPFRDMFPIMQALLAGNEQGTLTPEQAFYFTAPRPVEELYDTQNDPDEVRSLAMNPELAPQLDRLRGALDGWLARVGDRSEIPEMEMIAQMWPGLEQPVTAAPKFKVMSNGTVALSSATAGASIGYRIKSPEGAVDSVWQVYSQPLSPGPSAQVEAKAIRYGFEESSVSRFNVVEGKNE